MDIPKSNRLLIEGNEQLRKNQQEKYDLEIKKLNYTIQQQDEEIICLQNRNMELSELSRKLMKYISKIDEVRKVGGIIIDKEKVTDYDRSPNEVIIPEIRFLVNHFLENDIERWKVTVKDKIQEYDLKEIKEEFHWVKLVDDGIVKDRLKDDIDKLLDLLIELKEEE